MAPQSASPASNQESNQGSKRIYSLDLDDIIEFPDFKHLPVLPPEPKEKWWMIYEVALLYPEIEGCKSLIAFFQILTVEQFPSHVRLWCQDKLPHCQCSIYIMNPALCTPEWKNKYQVGSIICLKNMTSTDAMSGYKVTDPARMMVVPLNPIFFQSDQWS
jgi:hypothetical protein